MNEQKIDDLTLLTKKLNKSWLQKKPENLIGDLLKFFSVKDICFSSSLSLEDQVVTEKIINEAKEIAIFTLDTGRLFPETYHLIQETRDRYNINIEVLFPDWQEIESFTKEHGVNPFYQSVELRKECCRIRKLTALKRGIKNKRLWITGLRSAQSMTRKDLSFFEVDYHHQIIKYNPLIDWSLEQCKEYIKEKKIPYNDLHNQGYPSIGCQPCTRAINPGEDERAGRWWWETPDSKECGLHLLDGKLVRIKKKLERETPF